MNELALFAGSGGGILGGKLLGWKTVCAVELDSFCAKRLMQRQNEGFLPPFPIWDDVRTFNGFPWSGHIDVVSGGFPCTDISVAGRGAGIDGEQSGLWKEMFRIICEVRPRFVFVENSPMLTKRGLDRVLRDLASVGFDAEWGVFGADNAGAPHIRKRIWILAHTSCFGWGRDFSKEVRRNRRRKETSVRASAATMFKGSGARPAALADTNGLREQQQEGNFEKKRRWISNRSEEIPYANSIDGNGGRLTSSKISFKSETGIPKCKWWKSEPSLGRVAHGVANRLDQLRALGNGQVPGVVRLAWDCLMRISTR